MRNTRRNLFLCALACLALSASGFNAIAANAKSSAPKAAAADSSSADFSKLIRFNVEKFKLANGLTVLLQEDHSAPVISYQTWFRIGSKYEETGLTGIAHLFEHMMFKGAKRYSGEQFGTILQLNGATFNAFTTYDYTGYHENFPSSKLELIMDIESDRMVNLQVTPENLKSEREVVKEERRWRVDDNPQGVLRELLYETSFKVHPYRWPVIGSMKDIDAITLEKARDFHKMYYSPNNAVLVIAGDFNPAEAKGLVEKYYGPLEAQKIATKNIPAEPKQHGVRTASISKDVQSAQFAIAYHTPKSGEPESYALDLLANILGYGQSSRLFQRMVYKDQTASSVSVYNYTLQDSGLFQIFVSMKPGTDVQKAQRSIYGEMWRPGHLIIKPDELQKAKNQVMKGYVDGLKTVAGRAEALAANEIIFSDYERLFTDLDKYNSVTPQQVLKAAEKYLTPDKSTIVFLKPTAKRGGKKTNSAPKVSDAQGGQQ